LIDLNYRGPHGNFKLTLESVDDIIGKGGTILGASNKCHPFRFPVEQPDGTFVEKDVSVIQNFKKLELDAMIMVGGDGTMEIGKKLFDKGMPLVGVPKTIDNDLMATDYTFGFNTAVETNVQAIDKIRDTAMSHDRVLIVEVMGRDAGWIALNSGIASAADAILIPEIPYSVDAVLNRVKTRKELGYFSSIIVISEGAKPAGGQMSTLGDRRPGEMIRLKGAADRLEAEMLYVNNHRKGSPNYIKDLEIRTSVLGYIQRGGSASNFDRILGTRLGALAVDLIAKQEFGKMLAIRGQNVVSVGLEEATVGQKLVTPDEPLLEIARKMGITLGDS